MPQEITPVEIEVFNDYWVDRGLSRPVFRAQIKNQPECQASCRSIDSAVGHLVRSHPERFGIKIFSPLKGKQMG